MCASSGVKRTAPLYVKAGSKDLIVQLDVDPPDTEAPCSEGDRGCQGRCGEIALTESQAVHPANGRVIKLRVAG